MTRAERLLGGALEIAVPILAAGRCGRVLSSDSETYYFPPLTDILDHVRGHVAVRPRGQRRRPEPRAASGSGFAIACVRGGRRSGWRSALSPRARRARRPIVEFLRAIPPPALLPFAILVIGVGNSMKVFIIAFVCVWPVLLNTIDGVAGVDPTLRETARVYGIAARDRLLPRDAAGGHAADLRRHAHQPVARADPDGDHRDGGEHQRDRLLRPAVPAHVRDPRDVVGDPAARASSATCSTAVFVLIERRVLRWHRGARASALS